MPNVKVWTDDGSTRVFPDSHVSMSPEEEEITIMDGACGVVETFTYAEVIDVKIDFLEDHDGE